MARAAAWPISPTTTSPGQIARLEERRFVALERRIEADLALGRHADLVGELAALVARSRCANGCGPS